MSAPDYQLVRLPTAQPFHCCRCMREKTAKIRYQAADGTLLCNGCYGKLNSERSA